ncbi:MAG TPA: class I SAM-dependent methyltransferase [Kofleriaceae bacterium]|nr:class I SAM-dependent methyltransferase [Kofleriaceae bacterium]
MEQEEFRSWVKGQDWYQTIELSDGLVTPGKIDSRQRFRFLESLDVKGKRVLDVGCNSGAYCLWAKRHGAREVVGVDIDENRLEQGRALARHEGLDITLMRRGATEIGDLGQFDVVLCFAVLTEIPDLLGALAALRGAIAGQALIELGLARPLLYVARSSLFRRGFKASVGRNAVLELRKHKRGWMLAPTIEVISAVFGPEFRITDLGRSVRYQMLKFDRTAG